MSDWLHLTNSITLLSALSAQLKEQMKEAIHMKKDVQYITIKVCFKEPEQFLDAVKFLRLSGDQSLYNENSVMIIAELDAITTISE